MRQAAQARESDSFHGQEDSDDRLIEIAEILAAGLTRLLARKSSRISADFGESSLALSEHQSGHVHPTEVEKQT
jgi:hypothetical protein